MLVKSQEFRKQQKPEVVLHGSFVPRDTLMTLRTV